MKGETGKKSGPGKKSGQGKKGGAKKGGAGKKSGAGKKGGAGKKSGKRPNAGKDKNKGKRTRTRRDGQEQAGGGDAGSKGASAKGQGGKGPAGSSGKSSSGRKPGGKGPGGPGGKRRGAGGKGRDGGGRGGPRRLSGKHVATVSNHGRAPVAEPLFQRGPSVPLQQNRKNGSFEGLALVDFSGGRARVLRELGSVERASDVVEAMIWDRFGGRGFRRAAEHEAEQAAAAAAEDPGTRTDLTGLRTFTVDPASARDFDDAVSAERVGDSVRLWIHIADVAAHVKPGSILDREAQRRALSVYMPGTVEPMLPQALSSGACSLSPGVDRLAVTTEVVVGPDGKPGKPKFYRSLVRSDARLDYDQLDLIFSNRGRAPDVVAEQLAIVREVAAALAARRPPSSLQIETEEPDFSFDGEGNVAGADSVANTEAHRLIEQLMVLNNELVAERLSRASTPALYRVHERPDTERAAELLDKLADLDVPTPPLPENLQPDQAAELLGEVSRMVAATIEREGRGRKAFTSQVLRTLKQARYGEDNLGHAGLGSSAYCHFTSPIRRYPDLVDHRGLLSGLGGAEPAHPPGTLEELGAHCSEREREAIQAERDADDVCAAFLLERELAERGREAEFEGEVAGLVGGGAFVAFAGGAGGVYEGFLPAAWISDEWFELNELGTMLEGGRTGARVRLGDPVPVRVERVEAVRGRVTLSLPPPPE